MNNLEEELEQAFELEIPEPDLSKLNQFDSLLERNKNKRKKVVVFRRVAVACTLILLCLACFIPLLKRDTEIVRYYGDENTTQISITQEFAYNYISENLPNYTFIFEDCTFQSLHGIYDKETETRLLAIDMVVQSNNIPYTTLDINIVLNKNYTYSKHSYYVDTTNVETIGNKKIYNKEVIDDNYKLYTLIERNSYNTYLVLNVNDTAILEKFKEN